MAGICKTTFNFSGSKGSPDVEELRCLPSVLDSVATGMDDMDKEAGVVDNGEVEDEEMGGEFSELEGGDILLLVTVVVFGTGGRG